MGRVHIVWTRARMLQVVVLLRPRLSTRIEKVKVIMTKMRRRSDGGRWSKFLKEHEDDFLYVSPAVWFY